jgi:hypothetical protein
MRGFVQSGWRALRAGWFLAFVLLALPNCALQTSGLCEGTPELPCIAFEPGPGPASTAIQCDIERPVFEGENDCATPEEAADPSIVWLSEGANMLYQGTHSAFALDWSKKATDKCFGFPRKVQFLGGGPFPDGTTVCLNYDQQIPSVYPSAERACIAKCKDLINFDNGPIPQEGTDAFCETHAHLSANFLSDMRLDGACTSGGNPNPPFFDPRPTPENVKWTDFDPADIDTSGGSNTITRLAPATGNTPADFNKGAASGQTIIGGGAWVEFSAPTATGFSQVLSLRESCPDPVNCPDTDHGLDNIGWGIMLGADGYVHVVESQPSLTVSGPIGSPYTANERFRIQAVDNNDGTAKIMYFRMGACTPAPLASCPAEGIAISDKAAVYPLRVDSSLLEQNATLSNVLLMRIIPQ